MVHTPSARIVGNPGTALARARWDRPENIARRVERIERELATIAPKLTPAQARRLRNLLPEPAEAVA